jgi:hypothetical protein
VIRALVTALAALAVAAPAVGDTWREIAPEGAACWDGKPWHFWYRTGASDNLVVHFQGGGSCWDDARCTTTDGSTFDPGLGRDDHPGLRRAGLFDAQHTENPVRDWRVAFIPYCTGDMHLGRRTLDYTTPAGERVRFAHEGQRNVRTALDWIEARLAAEGRPPARILVSGESAGAVAASYWGLEIGDRFPDSALAVVGDAAGAYRAARINAILRHWGALDGLPPTVAFAKPDEIYLESYYRAIAERHPRAHLAQVNHADDTVQRGYMTLMQAPTDDFTKGLTCNLNEIRRDAANFHSFIHPGTGHSMLGSAALYDARCEGQSLVDWVTRVIDGAPVENRWCDGATAPFSQVRVPRL